MALPQYTTGYSIGVGGVVCRDRKVLFVRGVDGSWQLPGGFVEKAESLESAVLREVLEESGVRCEVNGIVGIRHRLYRDEKSGAVDENSIYVVFKLQPHPDDDPPKPDGVET